MFLKPLSLTVCLAFAAPAVAQQDATDRLFDALGVPEVIEIMRTEGLDYGTRIGDDMLPGGSTAAWEASVARIYDTDRMADTVRAGFDDAFGDADLGPLIDFFTSEQGERIVELELSARQAMTAQDVEDAARERFRALEDEEDARIEDVTRFIEANDLLESNVTGSLNASYQFYSGLVDGNALEMPESDILRDVWSQEPETREDTREWLYAYLLMAYGPLEDDAFAAYLDLSESEEGRALNRGLFAGFNQMYDAISYALGLAVAQQITAQEL